MSIIICPSCKKQTSISLEECIHCNADVTLAIKEFKIKSQKEEDLNTNNITDAKLRNDFMSDKLSLDEAQSKQAVLNKEKKEQDKKAEEKRKAEVLAKLEKERDKKIHKEAESNSLTQGCGCGCLTYFLPFLLLGLDTDDSEAYIFLFLGIVVFFLVKKFAYKPNCNLARKKMLEKEQADKEKKERTKLAAKNKITDKKIKLDYVNNNIDLDLAILQQEKVNKKKAAQKKKEEEAKKKAAELKAERDAAKAAEAKLKKLELKKKKEADAKKKASEDDLLDSFLDD